MPASSAAPLDWCSPAGGCSGVIRPPWHRARASRTATMAGSPSLFKMGAFLVLTLLEMEGTGRSISDMSGLARRDPIIASSMFVFMLSLAGIPPLSGFLSKFLMINGLVTTTTDTGAVTATNAMSWLQSVDPYFLLALAIVLNSALSLFYYLRIGLLMFFEEPVSDSSLPKAPLLRVAILVSMVLTVLFGLGPASEWLLSLVETAISTF